ncbi:MAG: CCA tRNA nucleotidyltransferase [Brevibacillus sp.]|nr:CCA tRNA nucleotidyltransferase [Brevibacillus sp.]
MLKEHATLVLERLENAGFEAYFVGGCVRDWLLGRPVHDIDICTNARPEEVMTLFPEHVPTGVKHGTVSVKQGPYLFEVTTYRLEAEYESYRRPTEVKFVSDLESDLARRDFTINAMALSREGRLVDPFYGQKDLNDRLIRAVGEAQSRFREDALRPLRGARFAAQLQFSIETRTKQAIQETAPLLKHIAVERIRGELHKLIDSDHPQVGFAVLEHTRLLSAYPLLEETFARASSEAWRLPQLGSSLLKWSLLCYAASRNEEQVREFTALLRMSKREREAIHRYAQLLLSLQPQWDRPQPIDWAPLLLTHGWDTCMGLDMLLQAVWWKNRDRSVSQCLIDTYAALPVKSTKDLAVSGKDLMQAFSRQAGSWIGDLLAYLLEQTALHGLPNRREDLLEAAMKELERHEY